VPRRVFRINASLTFSQPRVGLVCLSLSLFLGACSDDSEYVPPTQWVSSTGGDGGSSVSPDGIWTSINSNGEAIVAVVTETGRFHLFTQFGKQGAGTLSVSNERDVSANFQFVTDRSGPYFEDGTTLSNCVLLGTVKTRQTMSLSGECTTTAGLKFQFAETPFQYIPLYESASSLATIAGLYEGQGAVIDIAPNGTVFAQDAITNCVINGQVYIIDAAFNAYDFQLTYRSCTGPDSDLNGATFVGIGYLNEPSSPIDLVAPVLGEVDGELVARFVGGSRL
jgi:hypothetical protein